MAENGRDLSNALAAAVEGCGDSVVRVEGRPRSASSGVVWSADGTIITSHHALEWDEDVRVGMPDGRLLEATIVGRDPGTDVALLRVAASELRPPAWRDEAPRVGHILLALLRPGRTVRARLGIVSALGDAWRTRSGGRVDRYLQADVALEPGFSGGLFVDTAGRAVGLATTGLMRATPLALPPATLRRVSEALLAHGQVRRGFLGIGSYPVPLPVALSESQGQKGGLMLVSVQAETPAARAGLLLGDVILSVEGQIVSHPGDLLPFLDEDRVGTELGLKLLRAGGVLELRVTVGSRGAKAAA
jgi:S1-C subfamily serine protease